MGWQDAPLVEAEAKQPAWASAPLVEEAAAEKPGIVASIGAGLGKGVGTVGLGAQELLGRGLGAISSEGTMGARAAEFLVSDAAQGRERLGQQNAPYKASNPVSNTIADVGGQVAATLPVGGLVAAPLRLAASGLSTVAPGVSSGLGMLANSVSSGGMSTGAQLGFVPNTLLRAAGGAVSGGASTALASPDRAAEGAMIGAAVPLAVGAGGAAFNAVRGVMSGPAAPAGVMRAASEGRASGYVVPPSTVSPTITNRLLEGIGGKTAMAQNASTKNQTVTNTLAKQALGIADDVELSPAVLSNIRTSAGKAYRDIASLPVQQARRADPIMNRPAVPEINPAKLVEDLKQARNDAQGYYKAYNRSADPSQLKEARSADAAAKQIESTLEDYAQGLGAPDLLNALREARRKIAMTYTVERALSPSTGNVDARVLAKLYDKGSPLSGGLDDIGQFASAFPKATQVPEKMGSLPQLSPLDYATALISGNPLLMLARPAVRGAGLSSPIQNSLARSGASVQQNALPPSQLGGSLATLLARGAPVALSGR